MTQGDSQTTRYPRPRLFKFSLLLITAACSKKMKREQTEKEANCREEEEEEEGEGAAPNKRRNAEADRDYNAAFRRFDLRDALHMGAAPANLTLSSSARGKGRAPTPVTAKNIIAPATYPERVESLAAIAASNDSEDSVTDGGPNLALALLWETVPHEVDLLILSLLGPDDLARLLATSRFFLRLLCVDHPDLFLEAVWWTRWFRPFACESVRGRFVHIVDRVALNPHVRSFFLWNRDDEARRHVRWAKRMAKDCGRCDRAIAAETILGISNLLYGREGGWRVTPRVGQYNGKVCTPLRYLLAKGLLDGSMSGRGERVCALLAGQNLGIVYRNARDAKKLAIVRSWIRARSQDALAARPESISGLSSLGRFEGDGPYGGPAGGGEGPRGEQKRPEDPAEAIVVDLINSMATEEHERPRTR